jgi:DivIVA domain-containing protein
MTADHGDNAVPGRYPHPVDGEGRFDVVVRGYDRRQVDEHLANLERTIARQRSELQQARSASRDSGTGNSPEKIGEFTGRLKSILEAAEEEAKEIRAEARGYARGEEEAARARLADLEHRRDGVVSDLSRVRGQLDGLLARLAGTPPEDNQAQLTLPSRGDKAGAAPAPDAQSRPSPAQPQPQSPEQGSRGASVPGGELSRPKPTQRPGIGEEIGRPISAPRPAPSSPAPSSQGSPPPSPSQSPIPRPTPSPRPRVSPPSGAGPQGGGPPGRTSEPPQPARNGMINRDTGAPLKRDEDGGHSAFGTGAR